MENLRLVGVRRDAYHECIKTRHLAPIRRDAPIRYRTLLQIPDEWLQPRNMDKHRTTHEEEIWVFS